MQLVDRHDLPAMGSVKAVRVHLLLLQSLSEE